ncbi:MAG: hypothetical protein IT374_23445 [Polyangiaceae bacterium]|nr:hypothetical protein [Polyangiaceae bacterium]
MLMAAALLALAACSSDSDSSGSSGTAGSGAGGATGSAGASAGGGASGTVKIACYFDGGKSCTQASGPAASVAQAKANCEMAHAVISETCPTANVIGCCTSAGATGTSCYYTGALHDAATLMDACAKGGGTWGATPP